MRIERGGRGKREREGRREGKRGEEKGGGRRGGEGGGGENYKQQYLSNRMGINEVKIRYKCQ